MEVKPLDRADTWIANLERQWGEKLTPAERHLKEATLDRFCQLVGKSPDECIDDCILERPGGRKISPKKRRFFWNAIEQFEQERGANEANTIRSFFIHNGIMMQSGVRAS